MRPSEAFEQSLQCLSVRRSAEKFLRGCRADRRLGRRRDRASYLGAGQWQGVGVHVLPDLALRGTASGNTCALGGQTTVGRVLVDGPWEIAR